MPEEDRLYYDEMKEHYRSDDVAKEYDAAFSEKGSLRHRVIASRERRTVLKLLRKVPHGNVVDIPAGTGKLAPVFKRTGSRVLACDVSPEMLHFARHRYKQLKYSPVEFAVCDAECLSSCLDTTYDVAVCLRLLHRVPDRTKRKILSELAGVADHIIASFGITSTYHQYRRKVRRSLLGGDERPDWYLSTTESRNLVTEEFNIVDEAWILPWLSQEKMFLLEPTK